MRAEPGIHFDFASRAQWIPAFAGMTIKSKALRIEGGGFDQLPNFVIPAKAGIQCPSPVEAKDAGSRISLRDCVCRIANANAEGGA